ncbi:MAG: hypothetical protein VR65_24930 [Desulfobulbaceae bacterium BRH_c16a]|nr:MAG: hypothetical protein VR65_24930 [Desulfobulbaceae bacterium BRH_c16a]
MNETLFPSKIAVHRWLEDNGWKISRSQFYDHCKAGLLRPAKKEKKYRLKDVEKYASLHVARAETGEKESDREIAMREEKLEIALERERLGLEKDRFDFDAKQSKYIPRSEFELAIVARSVAFMAHLNHSIQASVQDWIHLVKGDQSHASELVEAISREVEQRMGDFAADADFDVILEAN